MSETITKLELITTNESEVWELAQFLKRVGWHEVRGCAVSDANAETMLRAISNLQKALNEAGYGPR